MHLNHCINQKHEDSEEAEEQADEEEQTDNVEGSIEDPRLTDSTVIQNNRYKPTDSETIQDNRVIEHRSNNTRINSERNNQERPSSFFTSTREHPS